MQRTSECDFLESIVAAVVVERRIAGPGPAQHVEIFVRARITFVVSEPIAVATLIGIDAAGDDVQPQPPLSEIVERRGGSRRERRRDETRAVRDEEFESFGSVRAKLRDLKPFGR